MTISAKGKDQGWAWVITLAAFVAMILETGTVKALGVMLPALRQEFDTQTWVIGLGISLTPGFGAITCPFAGALSKRLSPRITVMTFSTVATIGLIMASMANSVHVLMISLLLTGFSLGAEAVVLGEQAIYFDKKYDLSMAIAQVGLSIGVMVMPLLMQFFLEIYGWRGTMLLLAGLNCHLIMCGALLRPFPTDVVVESSDIEVVIPGGGDLQELEHHQHHKQDKSLLQHIVHYLDLTLFLNPDFTSMVFYTLASGYCFTGWLIYLVPHARKLAFHPYESSFLATIGGIGNLLASICYPIIKTCSPDKFTLYITSLLATFALGLDPLVSLRHSYLGLALSSGMFVLARGMAILSVYKIVKTVVADEMMTNAILWINVSYSIGSICSGFFSGWTFDVTGDYILPFLLLTAISLLALCPQIIVDTRHLWWKQSKYTPL